MSRRERAKVTRRRFLESVACGVASGRAVLAAITTRDADEPFFLTRGAVITAEDLTLPDWAERAKAAGLTTLGLHAPNSPRRLAKCMRSETGRKLLDTCRRLCLAVEYELHAMEDLLPRDLFDKEPELFRMDDSGARVRKGNFCVHSERAMQIVAENAVDLARTLRPTSGRYFYWGDDGCPWCRCRRCAGLSDSDQALLVANRILDALRAFDAKAQLAHLAYDNTLPPPKQIRPKPGIFLEYAPIHRRYDVPFEQAGDAKSRQQFEMLDANLEVFGRAHAQALEYWLDASLFSRWKRPAVKVPFDPRVLAADLDTYGRRGIRHITTFAAYIDAEYVSHHGQPPLTEYGESLRTWRPGKASIPASPGCASYRWNSVNANADFAARDGAGALVFDGQMWLLGGWNPGDPAHFPRKCNSEVWSSTGGAAWTLVNRAAPWEPRHTAGYVVHRGQMWVIGGDPLQGHYQDDVWRSRDGVRWERVCERVPWASRALHYTVAFDDRIWVMGGQTVPQFAPAAEAFYNDVWSSEDGVSWTRVAEHAPWEPRGMIGGGAVFQGRIWLLGGGTYDTPGTPARRFYNDVWSTADGVRWKRHTERAAWPPRQYHEVAVFDNRLWVLEGWNRSNRNDVWYSSDGVEWHELRGTPWAPRHAASVFVFKDALWMVAGNNMTPDVWRLTRAED